MDSIDKRFREQAYGIKATVDSHLYLAEQGTITWGECLGDLEVELNELLKERL